MYFNEIKDLMKMRTINNLIFRSKIKLINMMNPRIGDKKINGQKYGFDGNANMGKWLMVGDELIFQSKRISSGIGLCSDLCGTISLIFYF